MHRPTAHSLTGTSDRPELTLRRTYATGPENLRGALVDLDRLARWFCEIGGDPAAVGDPFTAQLGEDPAQPATGRVLACEEDLIRVSWTWQGEAQSVITARVIPLGDRLTELRLHHALAEPAHAVGYGGGWAQILESLARSLDAADPEAADDETIEREAVESWRTLTRAPLQIERRLAAPIDRVWQALASPEGLRRWWWSHWSDVAIAADVRPGGTYRIEAPSAQIMLEGTYLEVTEPSHLSFTWTWRDAEGESVDEAVDLRLAQEAPGATVLTLRHSGPWADDSPAEDCRRSWEDTLGALDAALAPTSP